jgi:hypothetical protein
VKRGIVGVRLPEGTVVAAPRSGVVLGAGETGPLALRLFRLSGTRVIAASAGPAVQLLVVRAAAAGTPVHVVTGRPAAWTPLLTADRSAYVVVTAPEMLVPTGGPSLLVDDRPVSGRSPIELRPWQCRVDVRTDWTAADLSTFGYTDLTVFGTLPPELTASVVSAFALPAALGERLAYLEPGVNALVRRGRLELVALDPSPAERQLLDGARGQVTYAAPIWR